MKPAGHADARLNTIRLFPSPDTGVKEQRPFLENLNRNTADDTYHECHPQAHHPGVSGGRVD
jgi:hypothetical protein